MTTTPPRLFDRALIRARLARAARRGAPGGFLLDRLAEDLTERLGAVTRRFPLALDLGTPGPQAARALLASGRVDAVVRLAPVAALAGPPGLTLVGEPEALPFAPGSLDLAVSLLALQAVDDLPGTLAQLRRALKPDGLVLAALLAEETLAALREAFALAEAEVEGGVSPRVAPFAALRDLGGLLQRANLALPVADLDALTLRYPDPFALFRDLRAAGATNPLHARRRTPLRRETLLRAAAIYAERHADPDGRVRARLDIAWLSGWAPAPTQPKPLKPGSGKVGLGAALAEVAKRRDEG